MKQTANREKGNILKNTDSPLEVGRVKIIDQENKFIERSTTVRSERWDLLKGSTSNSSNSSIKLNLDNFEEYRRLEILPQSRVDAFIASKKPAERYEALVHFWGGQDDSDYYRAVSELVKYSEKTISSLKDEIKVLRSEVILILVPNEKSTLVEDLLNLLISKKALNIEVSSINSIKTDEDVDKINVEISNTIAKLENRKYDISDKIDNIKYLINEYHSFQAISDRKNTITNSINEGKRKLNKLQEVVLLKINEQEKKAFVQELDNKIKDLNYLQTNKELFVELYNSIETKNKSISLYSLENQDLNNKLSGYEYDRILSTQQIEKLLIERKHVLDDFDNLNAIKVQYDFFTKRSSHIDNRLGVIRKIISIREKIVQNNNIEINRLKSLNKLKFDDIVTESNVEGLSINYQLLDMLKKYKEDIEKLNIQIKNHQENEKRVETLNDSLQALLTLSYEHISVTNSNICPVCNTVHESFHDLIDKVRLNSEDVIRLENSKHAIEDLEVKLNDINILIQTSLIEYQNGNNISIVDAQGRKEVFENKLSKSLSLLMHYNVYKESNDNTLRRLRSSLLTYKVDINTINDSLDALRISLSTKDNILESSKAVLANTINKINEINKRVALNNSYIAQANEELFSYNNNSFYNIVNTTLGKLQISTDEFLRKSFDDKVSSSQKEKATVYTELNVLIELIKKNENEIGNIDVSAVRQQIQDDEYNLNLIIIDYNSFVSQYIKVVESSEYNNLILENKLNEVSGELNELNELILNLRRLKENIDVFSNNIRINEKREAISVLENTLEKHEDIITNLTSTQVQLSEFLKNKINQIFNHDIINDIYQKIDPHPSFKHIRLEPVFQNEKPELLIKVIDNNNNSVVDPILYLSSAQVSILSLSIFLAKAIQNSSPLVNTIFMDDPIQYMDSINILSFIDLLRSIISDKNIDRQIVLSTHDENFFRLLKKKFDSNYYQSKFIEFESYGVLKYN